MEGFLLDEDDTDAKNFCVTIVWQDPSADSNVMTYYSRVLNQDLTGVRMEGNYLNLVALARLSWTVAGSRASSRNGLAHSNEFKVSICKGFNFCPNHSKELRVGISNGYTFHPISSLIVGSYYVSFVCIVGSYQ